MSFMASFGTSLGHSWRDEWIFLEYYLHVHVCVSDSPWNCWQESGNASVTGRSGCRSDKDTYLWKNPQENVQLNVGKLTLMMLCSRQTSSSAAVLKNHASAKHLSWIKLICLKVSISLAAAVDTCRGGFRGRWALGWWSAQCPENLVTNKKP